MSSEKCAYPGCQEPATAVSVSTPAEDRDNPDTWYCIKHVSGGFYSLDQDADQEFLRANRGRQFRAQAS